MAGVWSAANDALTERTDVSGFGAQSAAIMACGYIFELTYVKSAEEYDGTNWAAINDALTAAYTRAAFGTTLGGVVTGGYSSTLSGTNRTDLYNEPTWETGATLLVTNNLGPSGFGVQNAGMIIGGSVSSIQTEKTEEFDGSSWSWGADLTYAGSGICCASKGSLSSSLAFGGHVDSDSSLNTIEFDGTSWSAANDLLLISRDTAGFSAKDSAVLASHSSNANGDSVDTEQFDGTSWSYQGDMLIARHGFMSAGGAWGGIITGGADISSEEYTDGSDPPPVLDCDAAIQEEITVLENINLLREVFGSITCGHITDVIEDNIFKFADFVRGTASTTGTGDSERLVLSTGKEMISETFELGEGDCKIDQNKYGSGQEGTIYYRTAATRTACDAAGWTEYTGPFTSLGFVGFKVAK